MSRIKRLKSGSVVALAALAMVAAAADPAERLQNPSQEAHARALFQQVRCVVCQNESIDDSEADVARDLRRAIREQVASGASDDQIRAYLVARYGEFVLLKPRLSLGNSLLWLAPFALVLAGLGVFAWRARNAPAAPADELTPEEEARLRRLQGR
ncbi:cytochrome c-type biogenesis protein [Phenylobacterium montanum]|uniref:cytochrome c-type biogenesis protein n=1 Tax=Phenylobacterium montanum TaxID=2823693 RepID=UPI00345F5697